MSNFNRNYKNVIGNTSGSLRIIEEVEGKLRSCGRMRRRVKAICDPELDGCGKIKEYQLDNLKPGNTTSCGECGLHPKNRIGDWRRTHGLRQHPLYHRYGQEVDRMTNPANKKWHRYGGRIENPIDPSWLGPDGLSKYIEDITTKFPDWEELASKGYHIDREDNDKGYWLDNIRFVSPKVNANNKADEFHIKVMYFGEVYNLTELCEELKITPKLVLTRISRGWHVEPAINHPTRAGSRPKDFNKPKTGEVYLINRDNPLV